MRCTHPEKTKIFYREDDFGNWNSRGGGEQKEWNMKGKWWGRPSITFLNGWRGEQVGDLQEVRSEDPGEVSKLATFSDAIHS